MVVLIEPLSEVGEDNLVEVAVSVGSHLISQTVEEVDL